MAQNISNLAVGSKVKFGCRRNGFVKLIWVIGDKNHKGYPSNSVTLVMDSERAVAQSAFDAAEPNAGNANVQKVGYGRYRYSNIRQWLNSDAAAGAWYTAQHSADQSPTAEYCSPKTNAYDAKAGFLKGWTSNEKACLLSTTINVGKSADESGGTETVTDKVFLLSAYEVGFRSGVTNTKDSRLACFSSAHSSRIRCSSNEDGGANPWWLRDSDPNYIQNACYVESDGTLGVQQANHCLYSIHPACNVSNTCKVSDSTDSDGCYTFVFNSAPTAPSTITVPSSIYGDQKATISWGASTDADGNLSGYILEQNVDSGGWAQIYKGSARSYSAPITYGWSTVQFRVKAYDSNGAESAYTTSATRTVTNNRAPVISGSNRNLGSFTATGPSYEYNVTDADGHAVTVVEKLDDKTIKSYTATLGQTNTLSIDADTWLKLRNGSHTLTITATDARSASVTRTLTFTKAVTAIEFVQTAAMAADDMPTKALVNIQGYFPAGCTLTVWICNNGNDASPTWEDITQKALNGMKHYFTNTTKTASAWGVKLKVSLLKGSATETCYIQSLGGNFA